MRNRERINDLQVAIKSALRGNNAQVWTALPGIVQSVNMDHMTCEIQPSIQVKLFDKTGKSKFVNLPLCVDVPVQFIGGGGFTLTFPFAKGDEGLIVFSCRCIDAWWQSGGVQPQAEMRMHDLSDGFFIPGFRSQPRKLSNVSAGSVQLRSDDGANFVEIKTGGNVNVTAATKVTVTAPEVDINSATKILLTSPIVNVVGQLQVNGTPVTVP